MAFEDFEKQMFSGEIYDPNEREIMEFQETLIERVNEYNKTPATPEGLELRTKMLGEMLGSVGNNVYIEPPFHSNMGGRHCHIGDNFYANFNLTLVDDGEITIGNNVLCAPNVTIATAAHPFSPSLRAQALQYNLPVKIGNNVWIGTGAIILPGVTIGDNSIIGAGSVVTRDIPANCIAVGNPCKMLRHLSVEDYFTYNHGVPVPEELLKQFGV